MDGVSPDTIIARPEDDLSTGRLARYTSFAERLCASHEASDDNTIRSITQGLLALASFLDSPSWSNTLSTTAAAGNLVDALIESSETTPDTPRQYVYTDAPELESLTSISPESLFVQLRDLAYDRLPSAIFKQYHQVDSHRLAMLYPPGKKFFKTSEPLELFDAYSIELYSDSNWDKRGTLPQPQFIVSQHPSDGSARFLNIELVLPNEVKSADQPASFTRLFQLSIVDRSQLEASRHEIELQQIQILWQTNDQSYMDLAVAVAKLSLTRDGLPIGAVLVEDDTRPPVITLAHNFPNDEPGNHAEINILRARAHHDPAASYLYSTLEPCPDCAEACHNTADFLRYACNQPPGWDAKRLLLHQESPDPHSINLVQTRQIKSHVPIVTELLEAHGAFPNTVALNASRPA